MTSKNTKTPACLQRYFDEANRLIKENKKLTKKNAAIKQEIDLLHYEMATDGRATYILNLEKENKEYYEMLKEKEKENEELKADLLGAETAYENLCQTATDNEIVDELKADLFEELKEKTMMQNELKAAEELLKKNAIINMSQDKKILELEAKLEEWQKYANDSDLYHCEEHNIWYGTAGTGENCCDECFAMDM
jgi:hypothetical protein